MSCNTDYLKGSGSKLIMACEYIYSAGSYVAAEEVSNVNAQALAFTSESFNPSGDEITSAAIVGGRTALDTAVVNKVMDGSLDVELTYEQWEFILYSVLGVQPLTQASIWGSAALFATDVEDATKRNDVPMGLPKYKVSISHGGTYIPYTECAMVNSFTLNISNSSFVSASLDVVSGGSYGNDSSVPSTPTVAYHLVSPLQLDSTLSYFKFASGVKVLTDCVTDLSITISNNLDSSATKINGSGRMAVVPGMFELTGSMTIQPTTETSGASTTFDKEDTAAMVLDAVIDSLGLVFKYDDDGDFVFLGIYNLKVTNVTHDISGQGLLQLNVDFKASGYDDPVLYGATLTTLTSAAIPVED